VQWPAIVGVFLALAFLVAPACWTLAGVGITVNAFVGDACDMMSRHAQGQPNAWVLDSLSCGDIALAWDAAQEMMQSSNNQTSDANAAIERAPLPLRSRGALLWHM